jgi:pimeloyl-ACP methyl ester carboxylesterase
MLLSAVLACGFFVPPRGAAAQGPGAERYVGTWEGVLDVGSARLRLVLHVRRAGDGSMSGTLDSPDQGASEIPATEVSVSGGALRFVVASIGMTYTATLQPDGVRMAGTFVQGAAELPLELARSSEDAGTEATPPRRPQNPKPPLPYAEEEVVVPSEHGATLAGTLTVPPGAGPFPAAVLVSGSGAQDRDETVFGHKPFLVLSDHLTRQGIAVLRYDDRGVGSSTGDFATATSEDFATDALAAVAFLKARADIGPVGIVGHSEGGLVGPMAAARSDDVDYVVMMAGPGLTGEEIVILQGQLIARAQGAPEASIRTNAETQRRLFEIVRTEPDTAVAASRLRVALAEPIAGLPEDQRAQAGSPEALEAQVRQVNSPWFRFFLTYDPRPTLERVRVPILALNGENDLQVPAEADLREVEAALRRGGNPDATTRLLPGLNHLFQTSATGSPADYGTIEETMAPAALDAVSAWILERFGRHD